MKRIITLVLTLAALLVLTVTACADTIPGTAKLTITPTDTKVSGDTATVTIPGAHTHVFDQKNTNAKYLASAASCTAKATYYYSCTCGEKGTATFESGETLPHTASTEWKSDVTYHWHVCTTCNAEMDKAAHTPTMRVAPLRRILSSAPSAAM